MKKIKGKSLLKKHKIKLLMVCLVFVFLVFPDISLSKTFEEYKKNVNQLKIEFAALTLPSENVSAEENEERIENTFEKAKEILPAEEKIEFDGTTFEVNNKWISDKIEEYKDEKKTAEDKRLILISISERLEAIEAKLKEFEKAKASETSKDEEKRKLSEILKREEFKKPEVEEESLLQRIWRWFDEWMKKNFRPQRREPLPASSFGTVAYVMQWVLYVVIFGLIAFLIYKFAPFFIKKYRERERRNKKKERFILGEKLSADETTENLFNQAEKLAIDGNLREAIRKGYIALLFELSERKLIGLAKHKTNRDYLRSIRKKRELHENMNDLTLNYERHWYGFEDADEEDWEEFKIDYKKALNKN